MTTLHTQHISQDELLSIIAFYSSVASRIKGPTQLHTNTSQSLISTAMAIQELDKSLHLFNSENHAAKKRDILKQTKLAL